MERRAKLYEGKAKVLYETDDADLLIQYFKDDATAFNAAKRGTIVGKGVMNNRIAATLFAHVAEHGVPTHFVKVLSEREMLVKRLQIIRIEVVVRNIVAGSMAKRLGLPEGQDLAEPVLEFFYKDDALGDPLINDSHIRMLNLASGPEMEAIAASIDRAALREELALAVDVYPLCREDCRGLCPRCGADLNQGPCPCQETGSLKSLTPNP